LSSRWGSRLASGLPLPSRAGGLIAIRDNPRDPYGKLLIISGDRTDELLAAARILVTRNNYQSHSDSVLVGSAHLPVHAEYAAPRWLATDKAAAIGTYTTAEHLQLRGAGSINIYFRLPPDLFLPAQVLIPLRLNYEYSGVAQHADAGLHVRLNGDDIDTIRLRPALSTVQESEVVRIPTGRLQPYSNTLTIDFYFGSENALPNTRRYAAIHRDSSLDLTGLPHSVLLPRLELFGDAGYPFTRWPDLSHTAVLMPDAASASDYEALLDMAGFFGAQTGSPATRITVTDASRVGTVEDKDLVVLGTPANQPLFSEWQSDMPVGLSTDGMLVNRSPVPSRILYSELPFRDRDWDRLTQRIAKAKQSDLVVEDFVSPLHAERSVVAILTHSSSTEVADLFMPGSRQGPVYGGVTVLEAGNFQSFLVGSRTYRSGHLDPYQHAMVFAFENYRLIPLLVVLLAFVVGAWLRRSTEAVAARRLAAGGI